MYQTTIYILKSTKNDQTKNTKKRCKEKCESTNAMDNSIKGHFTL